MITNYNTNTPASSGNNSTGGGSGNMLLTIAVLGLAAFAAYHLLIKQPKVVEQNK